MKRISSKLKANCRIMWVLSGLFLEKDYFNICFKTFHFLAISPMTIEQIPLNRVYVYQLLFLDLEVKQIRKVHAG
jgi:hypothetical protein